MTSQDLKPGMVIETRDKDRFLIIRKDNGVLYGINNDLWFDIKKCNSDLTYKGYPECDIMKVYEPYVNSLGGMLNDGIGVPIWERKEPKKMTVSEICKELGYEVEIVKE